MTQEGMRPIQTNITNKEQRNEDDNEDAEDRDRAMVSDNDTESQGSELR